MSDTTPQSVSNGCRKYVKSRMDFNNFNTFINVDLLQIMDIIKSAVDAGIQEYKRSVEPDIDYVTQSEAQRYLRRLGYRPSILFKWKSENLLTPVKTGDSKNSSVLYSMAEIKKLVCSIQIKNLLT